jgi:hypothetical protein
MTEAEQTKPRVAYCPTCHTRYATDADECLTCNTALVAEQPRDTPIFRPKIDVPFAVLAALFLAFFGRLPGEAQSFGLIFLLVGFLTILTFRLIDHAEWLGRR